MKCRLQQGVSLVEAMVALGVMAFGMMGLVGLQATMRANADIAKQRAEAVRIAQERLENWRSFTQTDTYRDGIVGVAGEAVAGPATTNTTYTLTARVTAASAVAPNLPPLKTATVVVSWEDRASQAQSVTLATNIASVSPVIGGALMTAANGNPTSRPLGRHPAIPPTAISVPGGKSQFVPNAAVDVGWVFNNVTGLITSICDASFAAENCVDLPVGYALLSGFINFAYDLGRAPTGVDSEEPTATLKPSIPLRVRATQTIAPTSTVTCITDRKDYFTAYYCAMPLNPTLVPTPSFRWSGRVTISGNSLPLASDASDDRDNRFRVCRYTPEDTNTPSGGNAAHPLVYRSVDVSLANQNYLIISAGDGSDPYTCPDDGPSTFLNSNTYAHQPALP